MPEMTERTFTVAHSAVEHYRTKVTMDVPANIADDPHALKLWLESHDPQAGEYTWTDAFDPTTDLTGVDASEIDGVDFVIKET